MPVHLAHKGFPVPLGLCERIGTVVLASAIVLSASAASPPPITIKSRTVDIDMARGILDAGLRSGDPDMRARAIAAVGMIARTQPVRERIEGFLTDGNEHVRIAAVNTLA